MAPWMDFLLGTDAKTEQFQTLTPQQQGLKQQQIGGISQQMPDMFQYLQQLLSGDPEQMKRFEAPSRRAFEEQTMPSIAERFTGMGAQKSSAFGQQLGQAGQRLEESLGAQREGRKGQGINQLLQMMSQSQQPSFDTMHTERDPGFIERLPEMLIKLLPFLI